jgi:hypothetical protein
MYSFFNTIISKRNKSIYKWKNNIRLITREKIEGRRTFDIAKDFGKDATEHDHYDELKQKEQDGGPVQRVVPFKDAHCVSEWVLTPCRCAKWPWVVLCSITSLE